MYEALIHLVDALASAPQLLAIVATELVSRWARSRSAQLPYRDLYKGLDRPQLVLVGLQAILHAAPSTALAVSIFFVRF